MIDRCASSGSTSRNVPSRLPCAMTSETPASTAFIIWKVLASKCGARGGELAQHDGGKPWAARGLFDQGADPRVELVLGRAGAVSDRAHPGTDGAHHVANDLRVELALAAEVVVEHRLVDPGPGGDAIGARGLVATLGELVRGGAEDRGAGVAHGAACHSC